MRRIHVTLDRTLLGHADQLTACRDQIVATSGMQDIDEQRLQRYGILTGTVKETVQFPAIWKISGVVAVEADRTVHAF